jgi:hypothetical protein
MLGLWPGKAYPADGGKLERELSQQLVRLVDVVYALVLVQGAVYYRRVFTNTDYFDHSTRFAPVVLALAFTYFLTIQSFVDYHLAAEDQPYYVLTKPKRAVDLVRFYLDVAIVGSYSLILLKAHVLIKDSAADISDVFWAIVGVFVLYIIWGELRRVTSIEKGRPYRPWLLLLTLGLYLALAIVYTQEPGGSLRNSASLAAALGVMLVYRGLNWPQNRHY